MKNVTFYYVPDANINNVTGKQVTVLRPRIPLMLSMNHKMFLHKIEALFDTGSDRNLFPAIIAANLGIDVKKGINKKIGGIGVSKPIDAYTHTVKLFVGGINFVTEIDFSFDQNMPILGREGFMDKFPLIEVNEQKKFVKLYLP